MGNICIPHWQIEKLFVLLLYHTFDKETVSEWVDAHLRRLVWPGRQCQGTQEAQGV